MPKNTELPTKYEWQTQNHPYMRPVQYADSLLKTQLLNLLFEFGECQAQIRSCEDAAKLGFSDEVAEVKAAQKSREKHLLEDFRSLLAFVKELA